MGVYSPELLFYGSDGLPDKPQEFVAAQPRVRVALGNTGSPILHMRGSGGDRMSLGAMYGDVGGEPELGWGLSFRAFKVAATADIGYFRSWDGQYRSFISVANGTGKRWDVSADEKLTPMPLSQKPKQ
jgi:hypothetical protein